MCTNPSHCVRCVRICNLFVDLCVRVHVSFVYILNVEEQKWHWQFYLTFQPELLHWSIMWYVQIVCVKILIILCSLFISLIINRNIIYYPYLCSICALYCKSVKRVIYIETHKTLVRNVRKNVPFFVLQY